MGSNFLANYFLGDDLVPLVLFEVFPRDPLLSRFLLEILHGAELHFLAHLVEFLDEVGIAGDAKVFPFIEKKLLVDEIAEDVLFTSGVGFVRIRGILLLDLLLELILAPFKLTGRWGWFWALACPAARARGAGLARQR
jgi:hypothetical protein